AVREDEVEDHGLGRAHRRRGERALGGVRRLDLVAGAAEARPERAEDLRLVVDDEHARPGARHAATVARTGGFAAGSASTNVAPCPTRDSTVSLPPLASAKPRAIASPRPAPGASAP